MKKLIILALCLALANCTTRTAGGDCIGVADDGKLGTRYKVSSWNVILGIFFVETVVVPIVVALDDFKCPVEE